MRLWSRRYDERLLDLIEDSGRNVRRATLLLRDLLRDYPERAELVSELRQCEQEGDRIAHDLIHRLDGDRRRGRAPFSSADGLQLVTAIDDVVDYAEQVADQLGLYGVEAPMEQAVALADVLVGAGDQLAHALATLRDDAPLAPRLVEIHRLENEGDRLSRDAVASLFADGIDPMVVIRWKDIFDTLEAAIDACETVAHLLEGISLKRGGR